MADELLNLIKSYHSISIIGMSKNAGKTTVLNKIMEDLEGVNHSLSLTSIGLDGETLDLVTNTSKPAVYVRYNTIIATSKNLIKYCDITKEILENTYINTPLGEVIIMRSLSDGYVYLCGPSITSQVKHICDIFKGYGVDKIIIDGALSRKTMADPSITDGTILCAGASLNKNMDIVIEETVNTCNLLCLNSIYDDRIRSILLKRSPLENIVFINHDHSFKAFNKNILDDYNTILDNVDHNTEYIFIGGAILDSLFNKILISNKINKDIKLIFEDGSKVFISKKIYDRLLFKGINIYVLNKINLIAVFINPFSSLGYDFHKDEFKEKLKSKLSLPIMNAVE